MGSCGEEKADEDAAEDGRVLKQRTSDGDIRSASTGKRSHRGFPVDFSCGHGPKSTYDICFWKIELVMRIVLSICACSSFVFPSFNISRINETSSGEKRIPCLDALVISASMTGARSRPDFPFV